MNSFEENLDKLIELFYKLKDSSDYSGNPKFSRMIMDNFDQIIDNFKSLKEQVPDEFLDKYGIPIDDLVENIVNQLSTKLEQQGKVSVKLDDSMEEELKEVEFLLKNPEITNEEIDVLLEKRKALIERMSQKVDNHRY